MSSKSSKYTKRMKRPNKGKMDELMKGAMNIPYPNPVNREQKRKNYKKAKGNLKWVTHLLSL